MQESPSLLEFYGMLLSQANRTEQNLSLGVVEASYAQMRTGRRNWNNRDRVGNQHQPRNLESGLRNGQGNLNSQNKSKGKGVADDDSLDPKGPCQIF